MEKVCQASGWDNSGMPLGIYISVPFCRTKCSYCNFASDVFSRAVFERYVDRVCRDIEKAPQTAAEMGGEMERSTGSDIGHLRIVSAHQLVDCCPACLHLRGGCRHTEAAALTEAEPILSRRPAAG